MAGRRAGDRSNTDTSRPESRQRMPSVERESPGRSNIEGGAYVTSGLLVGGDFSQAAFERHATLLTDPRLSHPVNQVRKVQIVRQLQRSYGNRYVQRLVNYVARTRSAQNNNEVSRNAPLVQAATNENRKRDVYEVPPDVASRLGNQRGSGKPLDSNMRHEMEDTLGLSIPDVHVHVDAEADRLNRKVKAEAFTSGRDIFFRRGSYAPGSRASKELLAHELLHVVHQEKSREKSEIQRQEFDDGQQPVVIQRTLASAFSQYSGACDCGEDLGNNCAHYLSDALIKGGYNDLDGGEGGLYRKHNGRVVCKSGRPVRAKEMRDWFSSMASDTSAGEPDDTQYWAVYQHDGYPGGHVVIHHHNGTEYDFRGTGDYPEWGTQNHYTW